MDISSFVVKKGQEVSIKESALKNQTVLQGLQKPRLDLPDYLRKEDKNGKVVGIVQAIPELEHIPFAFDAGLFTEYYAARKA